MKPLAYALALVAGILAMPALAASRTYDVQSFDAISAADGVTVIVAVGQPQAVVAEAPADSALNRLKVEVRGGRLHLGIDWNFFSWLTELGQRRQIVVNVAVPELVSAEASSGADLDVAGVAAGSLGLEASSGASLAADLGTMTGITAEASSGAYLTVTGSCDHLNAEASSGGRVEAGGLACADVHAEASSGGTAVVRATASIVGDASSGGGVIVRGRPPRAQVESSSGGSVRYED